MKDAGAADHKSGLSRIKDLGDCKAPKQSPGAVYDIDYAVSHVSSAVKDVMQERSLCAASATSRPEPRRQAHRLSRQ